MRVKIVMSWRKYIFTSLLISFFSLYAGGTAYAEEAPLQIQLDVQATQTTSFSFFILNYDPAFTWQETSTSGTLRVTEHLEQQAAEIDITGLSEGESVTVTVSASRDGYETGIAQYQVTTHTSPFIPQLSSPISTPDGFKIQVLNYRSKLEWQPSDGGWHTSISDTGVITVLGLEPNTTFSTTIYAVDGDNPNNNFEITGSSLPLQVTPPNPSPPPIIPPTPPAPPVVEFNLPVPPKVELPTVVTKVAPNNPVITPSPRQVPTPSSFEPSSAIESMATAPTPMPTPTSPHLSPTDVGALPDFPPIKVIAPPARKVSEKVLITKFSSSKATAPLVSVKAGERYSPVIKSLPKKKSFTATLSFNGKVIAKKTFTSNASGVATIPSFAVNNAGTYLITVKSTTATFYFKVKSSL